MKMALTFCFGLRRGMKRGFHHFPPESKAASIEGKHPSSPARKKCKTIPSAGKVLLTVFWDAQGVLLLDFLEIATINATRYNDTLSKLKEAIRKKWAGLLTSGVRLLGDNAKPQSAMAMQNHIATLGWKRLHHPPYSPDLAPSDFHLFPALKKNLGGRRFGSNTEVKQAVQRFFHMQSPDFFLEFFLKLIKR